MLSKSRNLIIKDVTLNYAKLHTPVAPFGTMQWELQISTTDANVAKQWKSDFLNVKEKEGVFSVSLSRKQMKSGNGGENKPPQVVDTMKQPIDTSKVSIGGGSLGNVIVYQYNYDTAGRKGVGTMLSAVQVTKLEEYSSGLDFDIVGNDEPVFDDNDDGLF